MPRTDGFVQVKGLQEAMHALGVFTDPRIFGRMIEVELGVAAKAVIVPAIQQEARSAGRYSPSKNRNRGKASRRGPLAKNVTVLQNKRKYNVKFGGGNTIAAVNVGPRAWYRHFVIQGTRRHSLFKDAKLRSGKFQARTPIHPGSRPNDFVGRAVRGKDAALTAELGNVPMREYKRRLGKRITL